MKKLACSLLTMVMVLSMSACSAETATTTDTNGAAEESTSKEVVAKDGFGEGRIGSIMKTYFFDYTVNSAYTCDEYSGYTPQDGNILLVADVTVKNTFSESIEMYDTDFQVQWNDDDDEAYGYPITLDSGETVSDEQLPGIYELKVNEERSGLLVFEVPEGNKDFSISYLEYFDDESEGDVFFVYFTADEK